MEKFIIGVICIFFLNPLIAQCPSIDLSDQIFNGVQTVDLNANNSSSTCPFEWYGSSTDGTKLGTGCSFTTTPLTCDRTFYIEDTTSRIRVSPLEGGVTVGEWDANQKTTLYFDTDQPMVINSLKIKYNQRNWTCDGEYIIIQFKDADGTTINYPLSPGCGNSTITEIVPVKIDVSTGTKHQLKITGAVELVFYHSSGGDYSESGPLDYSQGIHVTGNAKNDNSYGAFFDWVVNTEPSCGRTLVNVTQSGTLTENCTNGIDDNCDGLIDYFDPTCSIEANDNGFYFGQPTPACQVIPPVDPNFGLEEVWRSENKIETRSTPVVGDIDGDGIPEVISYTTGNAGNHLYVFNGLDGTTEVEMNPEISAYSQSASIADTDGDGLGEIYIVDKFRNLLCYENDGTPKVGFISPKVGAGPDAPDNDYHPAFADFNGDGNVEIYIANQIFNSLTGALIAEPLDPENSSKGGSGANPAHAYPAAWDILPDDFCSDCSGTELICGNVVYSVNQNTGVLTVVSTPEDLTNSNDGKVALADWDGDGQMDIVVSTACCGWGGSIYIWDPRKKSLITQDAGGNPLVGNPVDAQPSASTNTGNPSIADFDGDGLLEIAYCASDEYIVLDNDLSIKWVKTVVDESNQTTSTAFDFEGDGITEIVYRDENVLYILDGATGAVKAQTPCGSGTRTEQPIVVDVDGDGDAEIVCACADNDQGGQGQVRVFHSNTNDWVNTRKVWHQHNYTPVYVNDDLTIPRNFQNKAVLAKQDLFFAQTPIVDIKGDPIFTGLPDIEAAIDSVVFNDCNDIEGIAYISVCNTDLIALVYDFDLSFYEGNPKSGGTIINTIAVEDENWEATNNRCIQVPITIPNRNYELHVYINDDGSNPANAPVKTFEECDLTNNLATSIVNCDLTCTPPAYNILTSDTSFCDNDQAKIRFSFSGTASYTLYYTSTIDGNLSEKNINTDNFILTKAFSQGITVDSVTDATCVNRIAQSITITAVDCSSELILPDTVIICEGDTATIEAFGINIPNWSGKEAFIQVNDSIIKASPLNITTYYVSSYSKNQSFLVNSDFEDPDLAGLGVKIVDAGTVSGWNTTDPDNEIEIWSSTSGVSSYSGNQFIELNANVSSALYQDMATVPGDKLLWSFAHKGRDGLETMSFEVGPSGGTLVQIGTYEDGNNKWGFYSGVYEVPAGQTTTRFYFSAVTGGAVGNFLDAIDFNYYTEMKDSVIVVVNTLPIIDLGNDTTLCEGKMLTLDASNPGASFSWETTETTQTIVVDIDGIYDVVVTDEQGCFGYDTIDVTTNSLPLVNLGEDLNQCEGAPVTLDAQNAGLAYVWNTGETTQIISVTNSDTLIVTVTDAEGCLQRDTAIVNIRTQPNVELGNDTTICTGDSLVIDAQITGFIYSWSNTNTAQSIKIGEAGVYEITVSDSTGLCTDQDDKEVFIQNLPLVDLGDDLAICLGNTEVLDAQNTGLDYEWNTAAITQTIDVSVSNTYRVVVTDAFGCKGKDTIKVTVQPIPSVNLGNDTIICAGDSLAIDAQNIGFNYNWNTTETTQTIKVKTAGVYEVEVTGSGVGCSDKGSIEVFLQALPLVALADDISLCEGENLTLDAENLGLDYLWSTSETSQQIKVNTTSNYHVQVTDVLGCSNTDTVLVTVNDLPQITLSTPSTICSQHGTVEVDIFPLGGLLTGNGLNGQSFNPLSNEVSIDKKNWITYQYTDNNTCTSKDSVSIIVRLEPIVPQDLPDTILCEDQSSVYMVNTEGAITYYWFTDDQIMQGTDSQLTINQDGVYQVAVTNTYCSSTSNQFQVEVISPELNVLFPL